MEKFNKKEKIPLEASWQNLEKRTLDTAGAFEN
jgi:hypothetical protein